MTKKPDEEEKKYLSDQEEGGEGGESGEAGGIGGQTGAVEFRYRDILSSDARDDTLPDTEIRRLLVVHVDVHKARVDDQKRERKHRDDLKNGRIESKNYDSLGLRVGRGGGGGGGDSSPFKTHPLSEHAQFSGATDRKVTGVPSDNLSQTNDEMKQDLLNELQLRYDHKLQNAPKFNPKPRPF